MSAETRETVRELHVTETRCACGAWFVARKGSLGKCPPCRARDRQREPRLARHKARVRAWYARRGLEPPEWARDRPDAAKLEAEADAVLERVLPKGSPQGIAAKVTGYLIESRIDGRDIVFDTFPVIDTMAQEQPQPIALLAAELADEAQGVASHCARLGHDYEVEGERVVCGRCGVTL